MAHLLLAVIYLAFIGLGLPDPLLGAAWPSMYGELGVPMSYAGVISMIISLGTVVSSLQSDRMTKRFGAGPVTVVSVAMTALALLGFSVSHSFWMLCLLAVPYGLGAGSVDAALNNYVALHYASRHMSWLHGMWGIGTLVGPNALGFALSHGYGWTFGYRCVAAMQGVITLLLVLSLPLWRGRSDGEDDSAPGAREPLTLRQIVRIPGAREVMFMFFCYCALEQTAMLWGSSYLALHGGLSEEMAARFASMFLIGITAGRLANGFLTIRFTDSQMIRAGEAIIGLGVLALLLPFGGQMILFGLILIGLGCAPIYPCIIHSTPDHFGADKSQAIIGVQMASAYLGIVTMPPLFGLIANHVDIGLFPVDLLVILVVMTVMHERLLKRVQSRH